MTRTYARNAGLVAVSGFTPATLSGLVGWWDAADASTVTIATGVSEWRSKVGVFKATMATANNQPAYQSARQNGRNAIYFDGVNDQMHIGDMSSLFPTAATMIIAYRPDSDTEYTAVRTASNNDFWAYPTARTYTGAFKATRLNNVSSPTMPTAANAIVSVTSDASAYRVYINNALAHDVAADFSAGTAHAFGVNSLGTVMTGWFYEVIYYSRTLSTAELTATASYLSARWGY